MTPDTDRQLAAIKQKLQALLQRYQALQKENGQLKKEVREQKDRTEAYHIRVQDLSQQSDALRLSRGSFSPEEKTALKKRIDAYLKEIENCLALLNRE